MTPDSTPAEPAPPRAAENQPPTDDEVRSADERVDDADVPDDLVPPLDIPFDVPERDLVEQRRAAVLDDEAWQHE